MTQGFCVKCRVMKDMHLPEKVQTVPPKDSGWKPRWMIKGWCPSCGTRMSKISTEKETVT